MQFVSGFFWLIPGVICEVAWLVGLRSADNLWQWALTIGCIILSLGFGIKAARTLPTATMYISFTGLGTLGISLYDALALNEGLSPATYGFLVLILAGIAILQSLDKGTH